MIMALNGTLHTPFMLTRRSLVNRGLIGSNYTFTPLLHLPMLAHHVLLLLPSSLYFAFLVPPCHRVEPTHLSTTRFWSKVVSRPPYASETTPPFRRVIAPFTSNRSTTKDGRPRDRVGLRLVRIKGDAGIGRLVCAGKSDKVVGRRCAPFAGDLQLMASGIELGPWVRGLPSRSVRGLSTISLRAQARSYLPQSEAQ